MAAEHENQLACLRDECKSGEITGSDRQLIEDYIEWIDGQRAKTTVGNHAFHLRKMAYRMEVPLAEASLDDLKETLQAMKGGTHPDVNSSGIGVGNYQATLRVFYRYHDQLGVDPEAIEIERNEGRNLSPSDLLFQDEVDRLLHACFENSRDRAFIALGLATCQRLDALRTLRLKHIEVNGRTMEIRLNEEEGDLKGASGSKPLLWAKHYVRPWIENHPYKDDPEAAVFCTLENAVLARDDVDPAEPMDPSSFRRIMRTRAEKAGIDKDVWPHLLRHSGITRMVLEGLSEQQIKNIVGWGADSSEFGTYVHLADQLANDSVRRQLGYPDTGEEIIVGRPTLEKCPECGDRLPDGTERCLTCNTALSHKEALDQETELEINESVRKEYRQAEDMATVEKVQLLDDLLSDPEVRGLLESRMD